MARNSLKNVFRLLEEANDETPIEKSFLTDLKRSIEMSNAKSSRKPSQTYKPSSMNCIRNMYYQVTGTAQDDGYTPYALVNICNSGSDIHERIQGYVADMKNNDIDCEYVNVAEYVTNHNLTDIEIVAQQGMETKLLHTKFNMSFLCDGIIKYKGEYYILELKTESSYKWQSRKGVDPKHYNQGIAYSTAFNIKNVIFVYISRDVLDMKSFMFTPTAEQRNEFRTRINDCNTYVSTHTLPPKPTELPKSTCEYCSYRSKCKSDFNC